MTKLIMILTMAISCQVFEPQLKQRSDLEKAIDKKCRSKKRTVLKACRERERKKQIRVRP